MVFFSKSCPEWIPDFFFPRVLGRFWCHFLGVLPLTVRTTSRYSRRLLCGILWTADCTAETIGSSISKKKSFLKLVQEDFSVESGSQWGGRWIFHLIDLWPWQRSWAVSNTANLCSCWAQTPVRKPQTLFSLLLIPWGRTFRFGFVVVWFWCGKRRPCSNTWQELKCSSSSDPRVLSQ